MLGQIILVLAHIFWQCLSMELATSFSSASEGDRQVYDEERTRGLTPESMRRLSSILCASASLGHEFEFWKIMERNPAASYLLDCRYNMKCPLEMAILRGHYELAREMFNFMMSYCEYDNITHLFYSMSGFIPFALINKNRIDGVRFCFQLLGDDLRYGEFKADWGKTSMTAYAKIMGRRDILSALEQEFNCHQAGTSSPSDNNPFASQVGSPTRQATTSRSRAGSCSFDSSLLTMTGGNSRGSKSASGSPEMATDSRAAGRCHRSFASSLSRRFRHKGVGGSCDSCCSSRSSYDEV